MRRRGLLIAGIAALLVSFVGATVQASIDGTPGWWAGHMFGGGHMTWWGDEQGVDDPIAGAREIIVTATDYSFTPAQLSVAAGEPVNLTLRNQGRVPHDLVIPDLDVHVTAGPGGQATTGIVIDEPGTFDIVCTLPGHATAGMTGRLEVRGN